MDDYLTIERLEMKYLLDEDVVLRIIEIKYYIGKYEHRNMSYDEVIKFLESAMEYDEMQIWILRNELEGNDLTLNEKLKKFFKLKSNDKILMLYGLGKNSNQNAIDDVRKLLLKGE